MRRNPAELRHLEKKSMKEPNELEMGYIEIDAYFSKMGVDSVKELVIKRFDNREKNQSYYNFINWQKNERQILVATFRVPQQLPLHQLLDCTFNIDNPDELIIKEYKIIHSLVNGWIPAEEIEQGRNHLFVLEFFEEIPNMFLKLHLENQYFPTEPIKRFRLGLCMKNEFSSISTKIKKYIAERDK